MAKLGVRGGAWHLPRWTLLGSSEEEVAATDDERHRHCYGGRLWVGSSPAAGANVLSDGDAYNDEGGGLCDLRCCHRHCCGRCHRPHPCNCLSCQKKMSPICRLAAHRFGNLGHPIFVDITYVLYCRTHSISLTG